MQGKDFNIAYRDRGSSSETEIPTVTVKFYLRVQSAVVVNFNQIEMDKYIRCEGTQ